MTKIKELSYKECSYICDPSQFDFVTTKEVPPLKGFIGQERVIKAMTFGLQMEMKGYNIYLAGANGTGKTSYAKQAVEFFAKTKPSPKDWCYVYNFTDPSKPKALSFEKGGGKKFKQDMEELITQLVESVTEYFSSNEYENIKVAFLKKYKEQKDVLIKEIYVLADKYGFEVKNTKSGIYLTPIHDGTLITEKEFESLEESVRDEINERTNLIEKEAYDILKQLKVIEKEASAELDQLENRVGKSAITKPFKKLKRKYKDNEKVLSYLEEVLEEVIDDLDLFYESPTETGGVESLAAAVKNSTEAAFFKYQVNLIVDHSKTVGAPVILDYHPTYYKLVGSLEYEQDNGKVITDFMKIKPGLLHLANGGYIILQVADVLSNIQSWEVLKRVLKTNEIYIESIREQLGVVELASLQPEPIPIDIKIILVGSENLYHLLYEYDEDFKKLFKIKCDFETRMRRTDEAISQLIGYIYCFCEKQKLPHFTKEAVCKVMEYNTRLAENQEYLTCQFNDLIEILGESGTWAKLYQKEFVEAEDILRAINEKEQRVNRYEERLQELMNDNILLMDTQSAIVGQINGLSVIDYGDYSFGKPSRITASVSMGRSGIINIEKESNLSGKIHDKGVLVLAGYIGEKYAQNTPFAVSIQLCFEQLYSGVDGDSASSAELYAILSNLADLPIKQSIAVTGSLNQKGEIQPVGGINQKIEGFFKLCKQRGLTGEQGVIIPKQNTNELVLKEEVVEAVKAGLFHIFPISYIDEGIEILMGVPAGKRNKNGSYSKGSIHDKVMTKLHKYAMNAVSFGKKKEKNTKRKKTADQDE